MAELSESGFAEQAPLFYTLFHSHPAVMCLVDVESLIITNANQAAEAFYGYAHGHMIGLSIAEIATESPAIIKDSLAQCGSERLAKVVTRHRLRNGEEKAVEIHIQSFENHFGKESILVIIHDISEQEAIRKQLKDQEAIYRAVVENANEAIFITQDGKIKMFNDTLLQMIGYTREELEELPNFLPLVHPDDRRATMERHKQRLAGVPGVTADYLFRAIGHGGKTRLAKMKVVLIEWQGRPAALNFVTDVTEAEATSSALKQREILFQEFMDNSPMSAVVVDENLRITFANARVKMDLGQDVEGKTIKEIFDPEFAEEYTLHYQKVFDSGQVIEAIERHQKPDGRIGYTLALKFPLTGPNNEKWAGATLLDITERIESERALRKTNSRLNAIMEAIPDLLYQKNKEGNLELVNQAFVDFIGLPKDKILGTRDTDYMPPDLAASCMESDRQVLEHGKSIEAEETMDLGEAGIRTFSSRKVPLKNEDGDVTGLVGLSREITDAKLAEIALRRSERDYRGLFENAHDAIIIFEPECEQVLEVNQKACEQYGYSREEFLTLTLDIISTNIENGKRKIQRLIDQEGRLSFETIQKRKDGLLLNVTINASLVEYKGKRAILSLNRDITDIRNAEKERRKLEEQVRIVQKMESLGILAGGIAHDFNNLLTGVLGNAQLLELELKDQPELLDLLEEIDHSATKAASLSRQMLDYSGKGHFIKRRMNIREVIDNTLGLIENTVTRQHHIEVKSTPNVPLFHADETQIRQLLIQLVTNASEAIPSESGSIILDVSNGKFDEEALASRYVQEPLLPGEYIVLEVRDNGEGMHQETLEKLFDPFFTTKFTGRGLGLAASLGIIRGHNGTVQVESTVGKGSTFRVYFPVAPEQQLAESDHPAIRPVLSGRPRILLVDDDTTVRTVTRKMLERLNYRVTSSASGEEALQLAEDKDLNIDLVLLDMSMPGKPIEEIFDEMRTLQPDTPIVIISGAAETDARERFAGKMVAGYIQKPMKLNVLDRILKEYLKA